MVRNEIVQICVSVLVVVIFGIVLGDLVFEEVASAEVSVLAGVCGILGLLLIVLYKVCFRGWKFSLKRLFAVMFFCAAVLALWFSLTR